MKGVEPPDGMRSFWEIGSLSWLDNLLGLAEDVSGLWSCLPLLCELRGRLMIGGYLPSIRVDAEYTLLI